MALQNATLLVVERGICALDGRGASHACARDVQEQGAGRSMLREVGVSRVFGMRMARNALAAVVLGGALFCVSPAQAAFVIEFSQVGADVVATGSGSFNTTDLTAYAGGPYTESGAVDTGAGSQLYVGSGSGYLWYGFSGPSSFGSVSQIATPASSTTGAVAGIAPGFPYIFLPANYVSGTSLSGTSTYDNKTIAGLGLMSGSSYAWTWGSGANADSLTMQVEPVPEPASITVLATGLVGLGMGIRRRRKAS